MLSSYSQQNLTEFANYLQGIKNANGWGSTTTAMDLVQRYKSNIANKTYLITGATQGLGKEAALALASAGAKLILLIRPTTNAMDFIQELTEIRAEYISKNKGTAASHDDIRVFHIDGSIIFGLRKLSAQLPAKSIDGLLLSAGVMAVPQFTKTTENRELQWVTNFVFPAALTRLLEREGKLKADARVVVLSSEAHRMSYIPDADMNTKLIEFDPYNQHKNYHPMAAYGNSKLAISAFMSTFSKKTGVKAFSVHPGSIVTSLFTHVNPALRLFLKAVTPALLKNVQQGAATGVFALVADDKHLPVSGSYLADCNESVASSKLRVLIKNVDHPTNVALWNCADYLTQKLSWKIPEYADENERKKNL